jgi:hypothetical protein
MAGTNPVVVPFALLYVGHKVARSKDYAKVLAEHAILIGSLVLLSAVIAFRMTHAEIPQVTGAFDSANIIEVAFARSILYPFLFPFYEHLTDTITLGLLIGWATLVGLAFYLSRHVYRYFFGLCLLALITFLTATIIMRPSLTQQLVSYSTTFPDRYFVGVNMLAVIATVLALWQLASSAYRSARLAGRAGLVALAGLYVVAAPTLFETTKTRFPVMVGPDFSMASGRNFFREVCITKSSLSAGAENDVVFLPTAPYGYRMMVPIRDLLKAAARLRC